MMRILFVFVFLLGLVSCGEEKSSSSSSSDRSISADSFKQPNCDDVKAEFYSNSGLDHNQNYSGLYKICKNGKIQCLYEVKNGKRNGFRRVWFMDTGKLKIDQNFKNGLKDGIQREWSHDAILIKEENYINDELISRKEWSENSKNNHLIEEKTDKHYRRWDDNGQLVQETTDKHHRIWHYNGQLASESTDTKIKTWNQNGRLTSEKNYKKTGDFKNKKYYELQGLSTSWHDDGQLAYKGYYKEDKKVGQHKRWYNNGQLEREENFNNQGELNGLLSSWSENGQINFERYYKNGEREGVWKEWYENGQLKSETVYKDGYRVSIKEWYEDGEPMGGGIHAIPM